MIVIILVIIAIIILTSILTIILVILVIVIIILTNIIVIIIVIIKIIIVIVTSIINLCKITFLQNQNSRLLCTGPSSRESGQVLSSPGKSPGRIQGAKNSYMSQGALNINGKGLKIKVYGSHHIECLKCCSTNEN